MSANKSYSSLLDYLISCYDNVKYISKFNVLNLNEFSDHCPSEIELKLQVNTESVEANSCDKLVWDSSRTIELLTLLEGKRPVLDDITR